MSFNFNWSAISGGVPCVSLSTTGISFNTHSIFVLGNPEKIIVGFDEEKCVIGVKAYENELNARPYKFAGRIKDGWTKIGCKDFIRRLESLTGIDFSTTKRFNATFDKETGILVVRIKGES